MLELSIIGIALQGESSSPSLLLHPFGTDKVIFLPLEPSDAFSLSAALHGPAGRGGSRRDLPARLLHALGGRLLYVEFSGFGAGPVQAAAHMLSGASGLRLHCRPAEGVLLALQCGAPLRAEEAALESARSLDDPSLEISPHVRTLARSAMLRDKLEEAPAEDAGFDFSRIPLVLEGKITRAEAPDPAPARRKPTINVTISRVEVAPKKTAPTVGVTLAPRHAAPVAAGSGEDDRWAALLQVLAPETKTLM